MLDPIRVEDLESSVSCFAPLVQKKRATSKKAASTISTKKNKAKRHCTICGSEKHNRRQCDQEPDAESCSKPTKENHSRSLLLSDTESTWNGFSDDNEEQSSSHKQGTKHK